MVYLSYLPLLIDWALLLVRVVVGLIFLAHGWPKLANLRTTWQNFEFMGFKPGIFWGTIVALVETFGGLLMLTGWYVEYAGILLTADMFVATLWKLKRGQKLVGGYELDLLVMSASFLMATLGPGIYSLENYLGGTIGY